MFKQVQRIKSSPPVLAFALIALSTSICLASGTNHADGTYIRVTVEWSLSNY